MTKELVEFCEDHAALLEELKKNYALETRNGSVVLHFDQEGNMRKIEIHAVVFRT